MAYDESTGGGVAVTARVKSPGGVSFYAGEVETPSGWHTIDRDNEEPPARAAALQAANASRLPKPDLKAKQIRETIRAKLRKATAYTEAMTGAAEASDWTAVSNAIYQLRATLQDLWELRRDREEDWIDVLNILQGVVERAYLGEPTSLQCRAIRGVVVEHLALPSVDGTDLEESVVALAEAGLDPFAASPGRLTDEMEIDE